MRKLSQTRNTTTSGTDCGDSWQSFRGTIWGMFSTLYAGYEAFVQGYILESTKDYDLDQFEFHFLRADMNEIQNSEVMSAIEIGKNISIMLTKLDLREVLIEAA